MAGFFNLFGNSNASQQGNMPTGNQPAQQQPGGQQQGAGNGGTPPYQNAGSQIAQPQNNNSQPNPPGNDGAPANNNQGNGGAPADNGLPKDSSLNSYVDIFKMPDSTQQRQPDPSTQPLLSMDPAKLREAASKVNFAAGIDPALIQKALQGDQAAFIQALNTVAQNSFYAAASSNVNIVEQAFKTGQDRYDQSLPERIRSVQIQQAQPKHPALSHPAAAPMVSALKTQIAAVNPHLTPDQVAARAEKYVIDLASDVTRLDPQQQQQRANQQAAEPDFSSFLG